MRYTDIKGLHGKMMFVPLEKATEEGKGVLWLESYIYARHQSAI